MKGKILVTLLLACGTAQASEWVSIGKTDDGTRETLVDVSSIRVMGSIRRAWTKTVFTHHTVRGFGDDASKWETSQMTRQAFNCGEEMARFEAATIYYDDGTNTSLSEADFAPWAPVTPETVLSAEAQYVCARGKK
jgi:hypothetical protein